MNILFFLTPKSEVAYVREDDTLRQAVEKMEYHGYAAVPLLSVDGRDIGTCVLPDAPVKIYLTASVQVRALRRFKELQGKGIDCSLEEIEKDIRARDEQDMNREHSPLRQAADAVLIDSSAMTIQEVIDAIIREAENKGLREA